MNLAITVGIQGRPAIIGCYIFSVIATTPALQQVFVQVTEENRINLMSADNFSVVGRILFNLIKCRKMNDIEALRHYEKLIQLEPNNINHYHQKGYCLARLDRDDEYLEFYDFVVRKFPYDENARFNMFNHVSMCGKAGQSLAFIEKAINRHPEQRNFYLELKKHCLEAKGEREKLEKSGCYIATACYGSYNCTQVLTFRNFRDEYLSQTLAGRMFIKTYYALSPSFAKWLENQNRINTFICERFLDPVYKILKDKY